MGRRIVIKGASGAGKSTLGLALARHLDVPFIELDALHHGPNWTAASASELRAQVERALDDDRGWVVDGNYESKLGTMILDRAEFVVWLDLPPEDEASSARASHRTALAPKRNSLERQS